MIIQYSDIPASDKELERNEPFVFQIPGYDFYKFKMQGLNLPDFYDSDRILRTVVFYTNNPDYSKDNLKEFIQKSLKKMGVYTTIKSLSDFIYEKIIPIPLIATMRFIFRYNRKYWRYPSRWVFSMKEFLLRELDIGDLIESCDRFQAYTIQIKKKLAIILQEETGSTMNMKDDSETSKQSSQPECAPVFLTAGAQIFGQRGDLRGLKKSGRVA